MMSHYSDLIHIGFIKSALEKSIAEKGPLYVGNNLNIYFNFQQAEAYANSLKKAGGDRVGKSSKDAILGRLVEELVIFLLSKYFEHNRLDYEIINQNRSHTHIFKIIHERLRHEKAFDVDIIILNTQGKHAEKYYLLSCKGTVRERIGQYISNLFLMDDRLIKTKYNDMYYLDFNKEGKAIKYGLVSLDWAKSKDFVSHTKKGRPRKTVKQAEIFLINDDYYIAGGLAVLNNLENLQGVLNFGQLVGNISDFLK